jgi:hypothetical protein
MVTSLKKPVSRVLVVPGKSKPIIVTIYPEQGGMIGIREKSGREECMITIDNILKLAQQIDAKEEQANTGDTKIDGQN